jgi:hypothetical protein
MSDVPSDKQNLRAIIVGLFPWLANVVAVTSAKGRGLAIRAAGGLLHLAGGPSDPAVARVADLGDAGKFTAIGAALGYTGGDDTTQWVITALADTTTGIVTFTIVPGTGESGALVNKNVSGSEKVTCA